MSRLKAFTLNLVYFCNILLLFLLIFEDRVELPVILQVTGRMHPLLLHFPLVLLFVGIFLEWLSSKKEFRNPATQKITSYIFYLFALCAALTALFGFFLYREGSYQGEEVNWHKWMGTAVSWFAVLILWMKGRGPALYYATLGLSAVALVIAGHLGAEITHGKGFLTEPIRRQWQPQLAQIEHPDSAVVFRDVIQPILNEKCVNCHNTNKAKNDLILSDYQSILKGGKNGEAIRPGNAGESLLYEYTRLPMEDSLHMPPSGKLQLDPDEIQLIGWWINTGAPADKKYSDFVKVDSIHQFMVSRFQPKSGLDLVDIAFADQEEIRRLNNPYRTVQQISATKPYIAVFLGSKKDFNVKDLTELSDISEQIVSIDLGHSNVNDEDLKHLARFPHLQKLHLQNLEIGDDGIGHLNSLRYLETLNISGTNVSSKTLEEIAGWESLKKLYLYNTVVSNESVQSVRNMHPKLAVYNTTLDLSDSVYNAQLSTPVCKIDSTFFRQGAQVDIKLSRGRVKYFYTLDGSLPTQQSNLYEGPFQIKQSCELKVIATMTGWVDSEVTAFPLLKIGVKPERVILEIKPDPKFAGKLDSTLWDGKYGGFNRADKAYLGYTHRDFQALFQVRPANFSNATISFLEDVGQGILSPELVEIWGGEDPHKMVKLGDVKQAAPAHNRPAAKRILNIKFPERSIRYVRLKAKKFESLPAGHPQKKKKKPSLFIDEIALQ